MKKQYAKVVFDRRATLKETGYASVEILVYLGNGQKKYVKVKTVSELEWRGYQHSEELRQEVKMYQTLVEGMEKTGEDLTKENLEAHLYIPPKENSQSSKKNRYLNSPTGFIDFIKDEINKEKLAASSLKHRDSAILAIKRFGGLNRMRDVNAHNVRAFHEFLVEEDRSRTDVCLNNYHKVLRKYSRLAYQLEYIAKYPYESPLCKFKRGEPRERKPLTEEEMQRIIALKDLSKGEEHARDLFVFSAYTGLAYGDNQNFDFEKMTETIDGVVYIDGERLKTRHSFFTPILPPALDVLKKYDFKLPRMCNQKFNQYLHLIERRAEIRKPVTTHVARHTFATLALTYDIPVEDVARMLGHTNIRTTQIYAKVLKSNVTRHADRVAAAIERNYDIYQVTDEKKKAEDKPKAQEASKAQRSKKEIAANHVLPWQAEKAAKTPISLQEGMADNTAIIGWGYSYTYS